MAADPTNPNAPILYEEDDEEVRPSRSGCVWGLAGMLGCLSVPVIILVILLLLGVTTVNNISSGLQLIFAPQYTMTVVGPTLLESVQSMSHLTTTRYEFSNIVTSERELPGLLAGLYGDRLVMVAVGHVLAGIDLSQLQEEDITRDGNAVTIRLPSPMLQDCFLSEEDSYVISRDTGIFASAAPNLDEESRQFALRQFRDMALERDILNAVQADSGIALEGFVGGLIGGLDETISQVNIVTAAPDLNAALPETCR